MAGKNVIRQDVVESSFEVRDDPVEKVGKSADRMKTSVVSATDRAGDGLRGLSSPAKTAASHVLGIGTAADASSGKLRGMGDSLQNFGGKLDGLGSKLTAMITVPLTAAATAATKLYRDAETSYAKVSTIADETVLSYDKLKSGITKTSRETGVAVTDLNEALYQSLSAGVDSGNAIAFTGDMVKLAKGGFTSTEKAVDVVTSALNAYEMSADQAVSVSDKLITTQNVGKTTVDQLASNLGRVIPTAKAFNVGIDDTCAAMADLTKNGIATAESTTYFNSMLNELGASGTKADKALREMTGLGFTELLNEGKSMTDVLDLLKTNAEESGKKLSDMFGSQEAGKAALTIMKDGGAEYNSILEQMKNSAGSTQTAFEKMDSDPAARMQKELNKLKLAGIDAGEKLLPLVTKLVEFIGNAAEKFSGLSDKQQGDLLGLGGILAASGPALKVIGGVTKGIGGIAKSLGSGKGVLGILGKLPGPLKLIGAAAAVTGIALKAMREKAAADSLKEHFGDVRLSMEECEDVARRLTTNGWTMKLGAVVEAKAELDQIYSDLETAIQEIEKTGWKVGIGLELTEEETGSFRENMETFIEESLHLLQQSQFTATLAIDATLTPGSAASDNLKSFTKKFQEETGAEMTRLGDELAQLTNDALSDNILSAEEFAVIEEKRKELQAYTDKLAEVEIHGRLAKIQLDAPREGLDAESFAEVSRLTTEALQENLDHADTSLTMTLGQLWLEYPDGGAEYDRMLQSILTDDAKNRGSYVLDSLRVDLGTLQTNFEEPLNQFSKALDEGLNGRMQELLQNPENLQNLLAGGIPDLVTEAFASMDWGDSGAIDKMIESMRPKLSMLEEIAQTFYRAGQIPPQNITKGLEEGYRLEAASGKLSGEHMWGLMASEIAGNMSYRGSISAAVRETGEMIPMELANALASNYGLIYNSAAGQFLQINEAAVAGEAQVKTMLSQLGTDAAGSLVQSLMEQEPAVRVQAMLLFSQLQSVSDEQKPAIAATLNNLGVELSQSLLDEMGLAINNDGQLAYIANGKIGDVVKSMDAKSAASTLTAPKMGEIANSQTVANNALDIMQGIFNENPITAHVEVVRTETVYESVANGAKAGAIGENAAGGVVRQKQLSWLAEDQYPETVISWDPGRRTRSLGLLRTTARALGVTDLPDRSRPLPKPEISYRPSAVSGSSRSYVDNSQYAPQFIANFGSGTATDREMEKKVRAWVLGALDDYTARESRRNPAVLEV